MPDAIPAPAEVSEAPQPDAQPVIPSPVVEPAIPALEIPVTPEPTVTESPPPVAPPPVVSPAPPAVPVSPDPRPILAKAREKIRSRKQQKLAKIMEFVAKHKKITNDKVQKLLRVSDATATRYLSELEKQGKIKQVGTKKGSFYQ